MNLSKLKAVQCAAGTPGTLVDVLAAAAFGYQIMSVAGSSDAAIGAGAQAKFEVGLSTGGDTVKGSLSIGSPSYFRDLAGGDPEGGLFVPAGVKLQARCVVSAVAINVDVIYKEVTIP